MNNLHTYNKTSVTRQNRNGSQTAKVLWFTGLSGSGKSTLAHEVELKLHAKGVPTYVLDGDTIRAGINNDLDFTTADRHENIRRVAEVAKLMVDAGILVLAAFISPTEKDRALAKAIIGADDFLEIYCECSVKACEGRDVKGLYQRARAGEIDHFTGVSSQYEPPKAANLVINTQDNDLHTAIDIVMKHLRLAE